MKTFNHPQLPAGWICCAESLRSFMHRGDIKLLWIEDDGAQVDNSLIQEYLSCDDSRFVNTVSGGGEYGYTAGAFFWLLDNDGAKITMADRRICLHFYTDDE